MLNRPRSATCRGIYVMAEEVPNLIQPLNADELLDIVEYRVPALWLREFTVQGFDPVDQVLQKFVEFCTR
eukprot:139974-Ditylum_brightwellii.AAC.2